jgi:hypothetical protein
MRFLDGIGLVGVAAYVVAYFLVQVLHQPPGGRLPIVLNVVGPVCLLVSLTASFNLASFLSQCFWLGLTLVGWWRRGRLRSLQEKTRPRPAPIRPRPLRRP